MNRKILIIDSYSLLYKAFYGVRAMSSPEGIPTNAIYGFVSMLSRLIKDYSPGYVFASFDASKQTFRHDIYEQYKAGRDHMPEDLRSQIPIVEQILDRAKIERISMEGYEADDIIGSMAQYAADNSDNLVIVTGDRDSFQLAGENITIIYAKRGVSDTVTVNEEYLKNTYSLTPEGMIDLKALMGDSSDNIPGVKGIGEKTALSLLEKYGSLDGIYKNIEQIKDKLREKLEEGRQSAYMSRTLGEIKKDLPLTPNFTQADDFNLADEGVIEILSKLDMKSLIKSLGATRVETKNTSESAFEEKLPSPKDMQGEVISFVPDLETGGAAICFKGKLYSSADAGTDYIARVCEQENIKKIAHDVKSLYKELSKRGIPCEGFVFDTYVAGYVINPSDGRYDLSSLAKKYLGYSLEDNEQKIQKSFFDAAEGFNASLQAQKADCIYRLYEIFSGLLADDGQMELYNEIEHKLIFVLARMEEYGFKVDLEMINALGRDFDERIELIMEQIMKYVPEGMKDFNVNSTKQLALLLFDHLGLPAEKKTKTGYSTDIKVLEKLKDKSPVIPLIIEQRRISKLSSTYVKGLAKLVDRGGRIHSNFNQTITTTGRISSSNPNLQNIPIKTEEGRVLRKVFIPGDSGRMIVSADYSQIELRVLAHIAEDENMISAFKAGLDIHKKTASEVFGVPLEEVSSSQRSKAKAVNFGIVYGISDFGLSQNLGISRKDAAFYIQTYLDKFPKIRDYMKDIVEFARKNGYVTTLFGRRRYIPDITSSNHTIRSFAERTALNTPIQGSAADIIKIAMVNVDGQLTERGLKSRLMLQVHDELIIDCLKEETDQVKAILKEGMEGAAQMSVPLVAQVCEGENWYEAK